MSKAVMKQALDALQGAINVKLWDGTYLDKDCKMSFAIIALHKAIVAPEPTIKQNLTVQELSVELDAGMSAQNYCRKLWGAARGHSDWRKFHEAFVAGYVEASTKQTEARKAAQAENELLKAAIARHQKELCLAKLQAWLPYDEKDDLK